MKFPSRAMGANGLLKCEYLHNSSRASADMQLVAANHESH